MGTVKQELNTLLAKGEERKRLTAQLIQVAGEVAEEIAAGLPRDTNTVVVIGGYGYCLQEYRSNLDTYTTIAVDSLHDGRSPGAITSKVSTPGGVIHLHGDIGAMVPVADREEYLHFCNNLLEIIEGFAANEEAAIKRLRLVFDRLRVIAGEGR